MNRSRISSTEKPSALIEDVSPTIPLPPGGSLTGGKFAYTWTRTSLTLDPDINPEGFNQKLSWDLKTPFLKNFTVQGIQLLYNEVARGDDSFALGGNVSASFQFGPLTTTPSFTPIDWRFPDAS
jgi:hypothetical protein